ncbi:hypothetical protein C8R42DRAFT_714967 [Lentinula raphanica]|nr:hypothetical protein C8R42DRAFT_714967 [Lentinula raphanica]
MPSRKGTAGNSPAYLNFIHNQQTLLFLPIVFSRNRLLRWSKESLEFPRFRCPQLYFIINNISLAPYKRLPAHHLSDSELQLAIYFVNNCLVLKMRLDITYLVLCSSLAYAVSALPPRAPNSVSYLGPIMTISNNTAGDSQTMTNFVAKAGTPVKSTQIMTNVYGATSQSRTVTNNVELEDNFDKPIVKAGGADRGRDVGPHDSINPPPRTSGTGTSNSRDISTGSTGRDTLSTDNNVNRTRPKVVPSGQSISSSGSKDKKRVSDTDVPRRNTNPK